MSYILTASGSSLATPVSIANGGTAADNESQAMINLSSPAFDISSKSPDWGAIPIIPPGGPDPIENERAINELIAALQVMGVVI